MSLKQRRLLFYSFILLFLIIAPFALLYATGRTINWSRFEIQKTGSMIIESEPGSAQIFLNNKRPTLFFNQIIKRNTIPQTNTKLTNLAPGNYLLRLELAGYLPWEKKTTVRANEVTHVGPIRLFKQTKPALQNALNTSQQLHISPDGRTVVTVSDSSLTIFQIPEHKSFEVAIKSQGDPSVHWSSDQENFVFNDTYVVSRQGRIVVNLTDNLSFQPSFVRWDNEKNDQIYYIEKNRVYRFIFINKKNTLVADINGLLKTGELFDYKVNDNHIFFALKKKAAAEIIVLYPNSPSRQTTVALPEGTYHFINDAKNKVLLLEAQGKSLYLLEQPLPLFFSPRVTLVAKDYVVGQWDKNSVLYATPFEIRKWEDNKENLISRFGEAIIGLGKITKNNEVLFATKNYIKIIPTTDQAFSQTVNLLDARIISHVLSVNDENIYFIGDYENQYGIYKLDF
jgi:hypothetical protein